jgi:hypothetical protein
MVLNAEANCEWNRAVAGSTAARTAAAVADAADAAPSLGGGSGDDEAYMVFLDEENSWLLSCATRGSHFPRDRQAATQPLTIALVLKMTVGNHE